MKINFTLLIMLFIVPFLFVQLPSRVTSVVVGTALSAKSLVTTTAQSTLRKANSSNSIGNRQATTSALTETFESLVTRSTHALAYAGQPAQTRSTAVQASAPAQPVFATISKAQDYLKAEAIRMKNWAKDNYENTTLAPYLSEGNETVLYVVASSYNCVAAQTDDTPQTTSIGAKCGVGGIAASRNLLGDLLPYGSVVRISVPVGQNPRDCPGQNAANLIGTHLDSAIVNDTLHERKTNQIDIVLPTQALSESFGKCVVKLEVLEKGGCIKSCVYKRFGNEEFDNLRRIYEVLFGTYYAPERFVQQQ